MSNDTISSSHTGNNLLLESRNYQQLSEAFHEPSYQQLLSQDQNAETRPVNFNFNSNGISLDNNSLHLDSPFLASTSSTNNNNLSPLDISQQSHMPSLTNFQQQFQRPNGSVFAQWHQPSVPTQAQPPALKSVQAEGQTSDFNRLNTFMNTM